MSFNKLDKELDLNNQADNKAKKLTDEQLGTVVGGKRDDTTAGEGMFNGFRPAPQPMNLKETTNRPFV